MSPSEHWTPIDTLTSLPLPILPAERPSNPNWHHHFHPKKSPLLMGSEAGLAGRALRGVRIQRMDYDRHNDYHQFYYGPHLPESEEDKLALIIMSAAGYIPEYGIDFLAGQPIINKIDSDMRIRLQTSGEIKIANSSDIRNFLRDYILSQSLQTVNVKNSIIDEFLNTKDHDRSRVLGHNFLGLISEKATESVEETYELAHKKQYIRPLLPKNVQRFTKICLGTVQYRDTMVRDLHQMTLANAA